MKKIFILLSLFAFACNNDEIKNDPIVVDSPLVIIDSTVKNIDTLQPPPPNIDSLNDARKKSRDSIRNSKSGK